ncbi:hypothetical protein [Halovulum sp. GXIMD14793]
MHENRNLLAAQGFHYPSVSDKPLGNAVPLVKSFLRERFGPQVFEHFNPGLIPLQDRAGYVERTFLQTDLHDIVLSAEGLFRSVLENDYDFLFRHFDRVRVIWVIRPKLPWLQSHYFQGIATGRYKAEFAEELDGYVMRTRIERMLAFMPVWRGWDRIAGAGNVSVLLLGADQARIEDRFVTALLGKVPEGLRYPPRKNPGLGIVAAAACAALPASADAAGDAERLRRIKRTAKRMGLTEAAPVLQVTEVQALTRRFTPDDKAFAEVTGLPLVDLQPNMGDITARATTLAAQRSRPEYQELQAALADHGIAV